MNTLLHKIEEKLKSMKDLNNRSSEIVVDILIENEHIILDMNTKDQLYDKGIGSDGQKIKPEYSPLTIAIKTLKGQRHDHVTLNDTNDFYGGFGLDRKGSDKAVIESSDDKSESLVLKYGSQIFGLSPENFVEIRDFYVLQETLNNLREV